MTTPPLSESTAVSVPPMPRRAFLGGAVAWGAGALAAPAWAGEPLAARMPVSMKTPGGTDLSYGQPSAQEASVVRREHQEAGFSVWRSPLQHQRGIITASGLHFAVHHSGIPEIKVDRHALMIHGLVKKPLQFDLERLQRYPMVSRIHFLECAGNSAANALSPFALDQTLGEIAGEVSCS